MKKHFYRFCATLAKPYLYYELPGWGKLALLCRICGPHSDEIWQGTASRKVVGKLHHFTMHLDLADWSERFTYFLGRYYDLPTQLVMKELILPGDRVVDIGANIGMITLYAAYLVGKQGWVDAIEPNPTCYERAEHLLRESGLHQVTLHAFAIAESSGMAVLSVPDVHSGVGTLAALPSSSTSAVKTKQHSVRLIQGDTLLLANPRPIHLIKLDIEGFELRALRGLRQTTKKWRPALLTEICPEYLCRAGDSLSELLGEMLAQGYQGWKLCLRRQNWQQKLMLQPIELISFEPEQNVLWIHMQSEMGQRFAPLWERLQR